MIMEKEKVYQMTNDFGKKFFNSYLKSAEILGIEQYENNVRQEFFVIFKSESNIFKYDNNVYTCILPLKENPDDGSCFFGNLEHFAMVWAENNSNCQLRIGANGNLMWPWWYHNEEDYNRWFKFYKEIKEKYS